MGKKRINIMTSSDDYISMLVLPQLVSIGLNLRDYDVHFYLVHSRIQKGNVKILRDFAERKCGIAFHEIRITDNSFYDELVVGGHEKWPGEAYYALLVQEIMPEDVDRVMYIDAGDVVIDGDISPYYFDDFEGKSIIATSTGYKANPQTGEAEMHTGDDIMSFRGTGIFNSGSYIMNVDKLRTDGFHAEDYIYLANMLIQTAKPGSFAFLGDQGLLSAAFVGDIKFFGYPQNTDPKYMPYNFLTHYWGKYGLEDDPPYKPIVLHFVIAAKPWLVRFTPEYIDAYIDTPDFPAKNLAIPIPPLYMMTAQAMRFNEMWWNYAAKTPIYEDQDLRARVTANSWAEHFLPICKEYNDLALIIKGEKQYTRSR